MNLININVNHEELIARPQRKLVSGSIGVVNFQASFDSSWDSYAKKIIFTAHTRDGVITKEVLYNGAEDIVPWEVLECPGKLRISAVGISGDKQQPTAEMFEGIKIYNSGVISGDPPGETPDINDQVLNAVNAAESAAEEASKAAKSAADSASQAHDVANSVKNDADSGKFNGQTPHIGDNGNWFIGDVDTGKPSRGKQGETYSLDADDLGLEQDQDTKYVYVTYMGVRSQNGIPLATTGGGDGSNLTYTITLKNMMEGRNITVAEGDECKIAFSYLSVDDESYGDGAGSGSLIIDNVKVLNFSVPQGNYLLNIEKYLTAGEHDVKIKVENSEGTSRTIVYTVTLVSLKMSTTLSTMAQYSGDVIFYYTPVGAGNKTIHFVMDGEEIGTEVVSSSGRGQSYTIVQQSHGAHIFEAYADIEYGESVIKSNVIRIGMMWVDPLSSDYIVMSTFEKSESTQGEPLTIPYMVYNPSSEYSEVSLKVLGSDGSVYSSSTLTVGRTPQNWVVSNYPVGDILFVIEAGEKSASLPVTVIESTIDVSPIESGLVLNFNPDGRNNMESNPDSWSYGDISATFNGIGFSSVDGWLTDSDGGFMLRLLPGAEVSIPFCIFANDLRSSGSTIEVEMATHNVRDYDTVVLSSISGERGLQIASQYAGLTSEQSGISMQFKEDAKVMLSFVIEPSNLHRLMYVYVDGVMCGVTQYPVNDNFAQTSPVGITIGANSSGIDVYRIRVYNRGLSRHEVLENYIANMPRLSDRVGAFSRNDIFDVSDNIVINKLPSDLPYMIIKCQELPQFKGDKKTCDIEYVNIYEPARSFTSNGVQIDVQGTSSAQYAKKNWKLKFKNGITYTATGGTSANYLLKDDSIPASVFCMKADVASSEGANNVELVKLYNDTVPYKTPAQVENERVRVGIDGVPCVIFWNNTSTGETVFWGKYNFNFDKSAESVYGLRDGCESWEIKNNTSDRVIFKSSDFTSINPDSGKPAWLDDFEGRYPDGNEAYTNLKAMCDWVVSTDRDAVASESEKTTRLNKFKNEFEDHFVKVPMLYYYVFTEVFLMVDSRAKNFFPSTFDGVHWFPLPYDMDTAIGINNEGQLAFDYDLEDTDTVGNADVFNGQNSTLWCNIRDAFGDEIQEMYNSLRSGTTFNYDTIVKRFYDHQSIWPEAIWNEDSWEKYLKPLEVDNNQNYLGMLQGNKASQREWWLYNGLRYRDSKYQCGDAKINAITLRCYSVGNITVTPYSHIWPWVKYGSYTVHTRGKRNVPTTLVCPLDNMNDTEVYIYSADRLAAIGDLSGMNVGYADFSAAVKLQSLKIGDGSPDYENTRLTNLYVGNNELLTSIDVQNCVNLSMPIDLSGCISIEEIKTKGTSITSVALPIGGKLKTLELPATVTNLTIRDQKQFETLDMDGYSSIETLRIENTPNIQYEDIINGASNLNRVRLINVDWSSSGETALQNNITKLKSCIGQDASGANTQSAVVTGRVHIDSISTSLLEEINDAFPELVVVVNNSPQYIVRYLDWDGSLLYRMIVSEGDNAVNAVEEGYIEAPTREGTDGVGYTFKDFGTLPQNIKSNVTLYAQYNPAFLVKFMNGETVFNQQWIVKGESATTPSSNPTKPSDAQYHYTFSGWEGSYTNVQAPTIVTAKYTQTVRTYTVYFYNGSTLLQTVTSVPYGGSATYTGTTPVSPDGPVDEYPFEGWVPSPTNIQGNLSVYAKFGSPREIAEIEDSWDDIIASIENGTAQTKYKVGNYKSLDLGAEGIVNMQIAAKAKDQLADGSGNATLTWISKELLNTSKRMNPTLVGKQAAVEFNPAATYLWTAVDGTVNKFESTNMGKGNTTSVGCWKINSDASGTLTIAYTQSGENNYDYMDLYVNGVAVFEGKNKGQDVNGSYEVALSPGIETVVSAIFKKDSSGDKGDDKGSVTFSSDVDFEITVPTSVVTIKGGVPAQEGTGSIGGWENTEMRSYLKDTVKPLIPENVRAAIKEVTKTQPAYNTDETQFTQTTVDDVWIPSYNELFGNTSTYKALFQNTNAERIKYKIGATSADWWWLRSAYAANGFNCVNYSGGYSSSSANSTYGVALGFCT